MRKTTAGIVSLMILTPVSYTHLDVYKRQLQYILPCVLVFLFIQGYVDKFMT